MFQRLTEAYEVLKDDTRRSDYDNELKNVVLVGAGENLRFSDEDGNGWVSERLLEQEIEQNQKNFSGTAGSQSENHHGRGLCTRGGDESVGG